MNNYSVALCTYNGERYIKEQLESIIYQSFPPKEIIISDDGSADMTLEIAEDVLRNENVLYSIVRNTREKGVTSNFFNAISLCNEEYIFTSDQDDVWVRDKAEVIMQLFDENKSALLIFSDGELVDKKLKSLNCSMWKSVGISKKMLAENKWFEYMLKKCLVTGAAMAFKKELFSEEVTPQYWLHDSWLAWKAAALGGLVPCDEKLILYRQHGDNVAGMNSVSVLKRVKSYISNFKELREVHLNRYNRYLEIEKRLGSLFTIKEREKLHGCVLFWEDIVYADNEKNRIKRVRLIIKHIKNDDFNRYFNGLRGVVREIIVALFYE